MTSVILGTAGHVDHGKTLLVEALTGVNTDRWEEERQRGITIDLGFAPFPSRSGDVEISVVDVPGHEDFVKNMLAGATGVDILLLVVAADEGPMPQTREHLWIARLLGVERGVVAITKSDLVDPDWQGLVAESVGEELGKIFGAVDWPILPVSAVTGDGIDELRDTVMKVAGRARARRDDDLFRMPVDRSFSVRGVGTVVTGTIWSGRVHTGAEVRILPGDRRARVRGIQVHNSDVDSASSGRRAALALVGVDRSQVGRGDTLTSDRVWQRTRYLDVELYVIPDSPWPLKHWQRVRFYVGTAETMARVVLYGRERLEPGECALLQLRLEKPVLARAGDRFVVRFYSPVSTVAGGVIIDPWARRRGRASREATERLEAIAAADGTERLRRVIEGRGAGVSAAELSILVGVAPTDLRADLQTLSSEHAVREVGGRWYGEPALRAARETLLEMISAGHARNTGALGVSLESLRSGAASPAGLVNAVLADLEKEGAIRVEGSVAALSDHVPRLTPDQEAIASAARTRIREAGFSPPPVRELAESLGIPPDRLLPILKFLLQRGELVAVTADLYYAPGAIIDIKERVKAILDQGQAATPSQLRQALGISRKYLIPLLEHLDATGFTQRSGEGRRLRANS
ncbi:MAG: selenocysteine-specific translation elongation factor [Gemmatimonadota bacterium]